MHSMKRLSQLFTKHCKSPAKTLFLRDTKFKPPPLYQWSSITTNAQINYKNRYHNEDPYYSDTDESIPYTYNHQPVPVKTVLYPNSTDSLINKLNNCASLQEVFNFLTKYENKIDHTHLTQTVLVLWDLQKMFYHINLISNVTQLDRLMDDYTSQLVARDEFKVLLGMIENKLHDFDLKTASCLLFYLQKCGLEYNHPTYQTIVTHIRKRFLSNPEEFSLQTVAWFLSAIFTVPQISSYFISQDFIPTIYSHIDKCNDADDMKYLSICLNNLNKVVNDDVLNKYTAKLEQLINSEAINSKNTSTILRVIMFLNYPQWRNQNTSLISKSILLLDGKINLLSVDELLIVYEIFCKNQEPASILNQLQRCACKYLYELEDEESPLLDIRLKLVMCIICFSTPVQRPQYENIICKYMDYTMSGENLLLLYRILQYVKHSDYNLCKSYWNKVLHIMEHDTDFKNEKLLRICNNYANITNHSNCRNYKFEKRVNQWIEGEIEQGISNFIPSKFAAIASFTIAYSNDVSILNFVTNKLRDNWEQISPTECMNVAKSLQLGLDLTKSVILKPRYVDSINKTLNMCLSKYLNKKLDISDTNMLLKSCIFRNRLWDEDVENLLDAYKMPTYMSSNVIRNTTFCLMAMSALVPEIMDQMVDYVQNGRDNVMTVTAEKVAFLCYYLGHMPKRCEEFFKVFTDIVLRDQERLSGLTYLQSCVTLCYFNLLSDSFIKQIFNTTFLEKLDAELLTCYSKDVYPARVRYRLMQLNRMICIDYPESNVPWFHQKYEEDTTKKAISTTREPLFSKKIKEYLTKIFKRHENIRTNAITPYGYHVDYVIQLDDADERFITAQEFGFSNKYAILLLPPKAFTKVNKQLKGHYQLKKRHLEMFGYQVGLLNFRDWRTIVYGEDKVQYLRTMFVPKVLSNKIYEVNR